MAQIRPKSGSKLEIAGRVLKSVPGLVSSALGALVCNNFTLESDVPPSPSSPWSSSLHRQVQKTFVVFGMQIAIVFRLGTCDTPKSEAFVAFGFQIAAALRFGTCDNPKSWACVVFRSQIATF